MITKLRQQLIKHWPVLIIWSIFVYAAILGRDFGYHWDESKIFVSVSMSLRDHRYLPQLYNFPSVSYYLGYVSLIKPFFLHSSNLNNFSEYPLSREYLLDTRIVFILISSLTLFGIYGILYIWKQNRNLALLSTTLLGFSWEFNYHSRWIARDTLVATFSILSYLALSIAYYHRKQYFKGILLSAIFAGLATGSKYTAGLLFVPISLLILSQHKVSLQKKTADLVITLIVFLATCVITTPGGLIETNKFIEGIRYEMSTYQNGYYNFTVINQIEHLKLVFMYLFGVGFSKYFLVSLILSLPTIYGLKQILNEDKKWSLIFLSFPTIYMIYMTHQKVMIVRNYQVLVAFLAILSGLGIVNLTNRLQQKKLATTVISLCLIFNGLWLYQSALSIVNFSLENNIVDLKNYVDSSSDRIWLSPFTETSLNKTSQFPFQQAEKVIIYSNEIPKDAWLVNKPLFYRTFGPFEINWDYYAPWEGKDRFVLMDKTTAGEIINNSLQ